MLQGALCVLGGSLLGGSHQEVLQRVLEELELLSSRMDPIFITGERKPVLVVEVR